MKTKSSKMKSLCKSISAAMHYEESAVCCPWIIFVISFTESESHSVLSNSLRLHGVYHPWNSPGQNTRRCFPSPGDLPNRGMEPRSPVSQVYSLPAEPQGKPKNTGKGSLSLLQWIFPTQKSTRGLLHCRWILYQLSYQGSPLERKTCQKQRQAQS